MFLNWWVATQKWVKALFGSQLCGLFYKDFKIYFPIHTIKELKNLYIYSFEEKMADNLGVHQSKPHWSEQSLALSKMTHHHHLHPLCASFSIPPDSAPNHLI